MGECVARVVVCHGVGYTYQHREGMHGDWYAALRTGMVDLRLTPPEPEDVDAVYYGNCFRSLGTKGDVGDDEIAAIPNYGPVDLKDDLELELLRVFAEGTEADRNAEAAPSAPAAQNAHTAQSADSIPPVSKGAAQSFLRMLERTRLLGDVPAKTVVWMIKQMRLYLADDALRACVLARFQAALAPDTRVVIGHSLGSVVAYEALCAAPDHGVDTLITMGSPLGLRTVSSRLRPPVVPGTRKKAATPGQWPGVRQWINIAAEQDPIALVKELATVFGEQVEDQPVSNPRLAPHSVLHYLTTQEAARGIDGALTRG